VADGRNQWLFVVEFFCPMAICRRTATGDPKRHGGGWVLAKAPEKMMAFDGIALLVSSWFLRSVLLTMIRNA